MPEGLGVVEFCRGIVDAVAGIAVAVKPQAAFFEAQGAEGWAALTEVCGYAREAGLLVIADGKRGDVPSTARAYAAAFAPIADAVTVNPYLGYDSLEPFFAHEGLGVLVILKTSNPGSADIQDLPFAGRTSVLAARRGPHRPVGRGLRRRERALLGRGRGRRHASGDSRDRAQPAAARRAALAGRRRAGRPPRRPCRRPSPPARRARFPPLRACVLYADRGAGWQEAAAAEAERLAGELRSVAAVG